jgi:hypothetical protein
MGTISCQYNILYLLWKSRYLQARTNCLCVLGPVLVKYMREYQIAHGGRQGKRVSDGIARDVRLADCGTAAPRSATEMIVIRRCTKNLYGPEIVVMHLKSEHADTRVRSK